MGKNEMGSPMNASMQSVKEKSDVEFGTGNVADVRIDVKNQRLKPPVIQNLPKLDVHVK